MTFQGYESEPRHVSTFAVIDLDRTLLDTPVLVDMLLLQLHDHGFDKQQVASYMRIIHENAGRSLSLKEFFDESIPGGESLYGTVKQEILQLAESGIVNDELLHHGSADLLDALDENDVPFVILTYGNPADQDFKLSLTRTLLDRRTEELHASITNEPEKARWIATNWSHEDGMHVPADIYGHGPITAETIVVIDDKLHNLRSGNDKVRGILVDNTSQSDAAMTIPRIVVALHDGVPLDELAETYARAA